MKRHRLKMYGTLLLLLLSASSAGAVSFDWAVIGNAGNPADTRTSYGSVGYEYKITTTEVTTAQYVAFLNAVAAEDANGLYNTNMGSSTYYSGINRTGSSGSYVYSVNAGWENRPVVYVSWYDTLRFANWLHNGQPTGLQNASTTEKGAYDMSLGASVEREAKANYWLPNDDEWYKAAYYSPGGTYYYYATGSDTCPSRTTPAGDTGNNANYYVGNIYLGLTDVGAYDESESPYGTYDQNGNVREWNETLMGGVFRGLRGSSWYSNVFNLHSTTRYYNAPTLEDNQSGFRVASSLTGDDGGTIPEPASVALLLLSLFGLNRFTRKK